RERKRRHAVGDRVAAIAKPSDRGPVGAVDAEIPAARRRQLAEATILPARREWFRVDIERDVGLEGVVEAELSRQRRAIHQAKDVPLAIRKRASSAQGREILTADRSAENSARAGFVQILGLDGKLH